MLAACQAAGVFHGLAAGYRWSPAVRQIRELVRSGELGEIRSLRASFMLDYAADPDVPLLWRFRKALSGGGIAIDTGYHLVDCARFLVGEIETVQGAVVARSSPSGALPGADAVGNRGGDPGTVATRPETGPVDVEDAAAALVTFAGGAYGVLETSRVAIGKRVSLQLEVFGSRGSADWDLERPDEFRVCLPGDHPDVRVPARAGQPLRTRARPSCSSPGPTGRRSAGSARNARCGPSSSARSPRAGPASADFTDGVREVR